MVCHNVLKMTFIGSHAQSGHDRPAPIARRRTAGQAASSTLGWMWSSVNRSRSDRSCSTTIPTARSARSASAADSG